MANLVKNFLTDFEDINEYYTFLVDKTKRREYVGITNEWLIDNFYLLVEHKTNIVHDKKYIVRDLKKCDRIFYCLKDIVARNNYNISFRLLVSELREYQKQTKVTFSYHELVCVKNVLLFLYTKRLADLCREEYQNLLNKEKVARIIDSREEKEIELSNFLDDNFSIQEEANYIFEIKDSGDGIRKKDYDKIFNFFSQVNRNKLKRQQGSGVGLALCKVIATAHHGDIGFKSRLNNGSTFWFSLPSQGCSDTTYIEF